ncbi:MAG TPA: hypothetical protein VMF08_21410 [Candidatus Sulfotelmatobacter sp.]|nr:hypothetical protein [Candidatus Sulfotelmatobacter sp.]
MIRQNALLYRLSNEEMNSIKPKELLFAHRYAEAVDAYEDYLLKHPEDNYYPGLGRAMLSLKRFPEALSAFRKANEVAAKKLKGSSSYINEIAATLWLMAYGRETQGVHRVAWRCQRSFR